MLTSFLTLTLAVSALAAPAPAATPNPGEVTIKEPIVYGGTGCPQGTLDVNLSSDRQSFTLGFSKNFTATIGPSVPVTENRKFCQINMGLEYPSGFQYSILEQTSQGYLDIESGVTALQKSNYYFSGELDTATRETTWKGPKKESYKVGADVPITSVIWSPCGKVVDLNINSQVRLTTTNNNANGVITTESSTGKVKFVVGLQWKSC